MNRKWVMHFFAAVLAGVLLVSCVPVKEYQKNKINDSEMTLANRKVEKSELNVQSYREGSSGANGGKTGGGCGCN
jgi:outer membrane murein-binding lipoprotein Lpp